MVSTSAIEKAEKKNEIVRIFENNEAVLYYSPEGACVYGDNYPLDLEKGEYIAVSRKIQYDVWASECQKSTKGSRGKAKKAFEKYSPVSMAWIKKYA